MPLNAREAMRGSPSPWKVFAMMAKHAREKDRRLKVSVEERVADIIVVGSLLYACRKEEVAVQQLHGEAKSHDFKTDFIFDISGKGLAHVADKAYCMSAFWVKIYAQ